MRRKSGLKAGLELEKLVSEELDRLNVSHRRTPHGGHDDTREQIDLVVEPGQFSGIPQFEFQLTLRRGVRRKMRAFTLAALTNSNRGIRVYLEILASRWRNLRDIARRVAYAIRDITRFRRFENPNLLGIRLRVGRSVRGQKLERFSLMGLVGDWVIKKIEEQRQAAMERRRLQRKLAHERIARQRARQRVYPSPTHLIPTVVEVPQHKPRQQYTAPARMFIPIRQP